MNRNMHMHTHKPMYICRFRDAVNFKDWHTAAWDTIPNHMRRALLARLDTNEYTRILEMELEKRGADIASLRSQHDKEYRAAKLVV